MFQTKRYRAPFCFILSDFGKCNACLVAEPKEVKSSKRKRDNLLSPAKLKASISITSAERITLTLQNYRFKNKCLKTEVDNDLNNDFISIMSKNEKITIPPFMKLFWEEQQKYLTTSPKGIRYHPLIIRYCLGLTAKSSDTYDEIRFDPKINTGFVFLPTRRRLRDYKNYIRSQQSSNKDVIHELKNAVENFTSIERFVIILMDEMKVQENLIWDKHSGDIIVYVDLGDKELNLATLKSDYIASHMLVFLVRSIVNPLKLSLGNFATTTAPSPQLFPLFWKAVSILEDNCNLKVVGVTSDGASPNRRMYRMHLRMTKIEDVNNDVDVTYKTRNIVADDNRLIYFISDPPHLIMTARNCPSTLLLVDAHVICGITFQDYFMMTLIVVYI